MAQTTLYTSVLILVVRADIIDQARAFASQVDVSGSTYQLFAGLSKSGNAPATHYWCHWPILEEQEVSLKGRLNALIRQGRVTIFDGNIITPQQAFAQLDLKMVADI